MNLIKPPHNFLRRWGYESINVHTASNVLSIVGCALFEYFRVNFVSCSSYGALHVAVLLYWRLHRDRRLFVLCATTSISFRWKLSKSIPAAPPTTTIPDLYLFPFSFLLHSLSLCRTTAGKKLLHETFVLALMYRTDTSARLSQLGGISYSATPHVQPAYSWPL